VYEAYKAVKSKRGAAGVDGQSLEDFDKDLKGNLYKIWNRMSSGSYFPPPVLAVSIPKKDGAGERILGVPTVGDRIAQMVVKQLIEPDLDPIFLPDSYGYRPRKSALDAVEVTLKRCWKYDWVLEFDIKGLFDNIPHDLLLRAVRKHVTCKWALLYIERWLTAPMEKNGVRMERNQGTPLTTAAMFRGLSRFRDGIERWNEVWSPSGIVNIRSPRECRVSLSPARHERPLQCVTTRCWIPSSMHFFSASMKSWLPRPGPAAVGAARVDCTATDIGASLVVARAALIKRIGID